MKVLVNWHRRRNPEFRIASRLSAFKLRGHVVHISFPSDASLVCHHREPRQPMMCAHLRVVESVLPVAPRTKDQDCVRIRVGHVVSPSGGYDHSFTRTRFYCDATARIISGFFLAIDDRIAFPDFEKFGRRPTTMG